MVDNRTEYIQLGEYFCLPFRFITFKDGYIKRRQKNKYKYKY